MDYTIALSYILCVENNTLAYPIGELRRKFIKRRMASIFPAFYFNWSYSPILTNQKIFGDYCRFYAWISYLLPCSYFIIPKLRTKTQPHISKNYTKAQPHIISYCTKTQPEKLTHHHSRLRHRAKPLILLTLKPRLCNIPDNRTNHCVFHFTFHFQSLWVLQMSTSPSISNRSSEVDRNKT